MWESSDYILETDRRYFETVVIRGVKNYPPDHLVLISRFLFSPTEEGHQCDTGFIPAQVVNLYRGGEYNGRYQPYTGVGWDIVGYESDPLPSHRWIRNRSYTLNFLTFLLSSPGHSISRHIS